MILYNQRKEFVGIDEDDLSSLDFQSINELQSESNDFADLFVKKPGYIHNFKNFSWIDFILHSEADESKAIIHAKGKNYSCALHITPFYFTSNESGYAIIIRNLRALKGAEDAQAKKDLEASGGIQSSPATSTSSMPSTPRPAISTPAPELDISLDDIQMSEPEVSPSLSVAEPETQLPSFEQSTQQELTEPEPLDIPEAIDIDFDLSAPYDNNLLETENEFGAPMENDFGAPSDIDYNAPLSIDEDLMHDDFPEPNFEEEEKVSLPEFEEPQTPLKDEAPMLGDYVSGADSEHLSELVASGTYQYDPSVAAGELGLPVDLIEEFIGDFIDQAHEFKDDLFASVNAEDFDNVQILSHKLKGVAANLRVEDAFDVLSVVNISKDAQEVLPNLNQFYKIIAKLEGKEVQEEPKQDPQVEQEPPAPQVETPAQVEEPEIDYDFGLKQPEDGPMLIDEEVNLPTSDDDDLYGDLLSTSPEPSYDEPSHTQTDTSLDDDIYDDLLASPSVTEEDNTQSITPEIEEVPYDDILAEPKVSSVEVAPLNFDPQSSANQLGIPVDIVKEFVQDFKQQVTVHQIDFKNALESESIKEINTTATLLKGMSDNLRLNEISEVLKELQSETNINNTADAIAKVQAYADQL